MGFMVLERILFVFDMLFSNCEICKLILIEIKGNFFIYI